MGTVVLPSCARGTAGWVQVKYGSCTLARYMIWPLRPLTAQSSSFVAACDVTFGPAPFVVVVVVPPSVDHPSGEA